MPTFRLICTLNWLSLLRRESECINLKFYYQFEYMWHNYKSMVRYITTCSSILMLIISESKAYCYRLFHFRLWQPISTDILVNFAHRNIIMTSISMN